MIVKNTFLFIRSSIFIFLNVASIMIYCFVVLASAPFPLHTRQHIILYYLNFTHYLLKILCHIDYQVEGLEHVPKDKACIVLSKHQSTWETYFLPLFFKHFAYIAKRELVWIPFFGWGFALCGPILINRNNKSSAMQQIISKGKKCLDEGRSVLIFPEGTRIAYGKVGQYKLGGARLAAATGYPVIPVAHNAGKFWPKRKIIKRPGTVSVVIGPPIESVGRTPEEILALAKEWIESTMLKL